MTICTTVHDVKEEPERRGEREDGECGGEVVRRVRGDGKCERDGVECVSVWIRERGDREERRKRRKEREMRIGERNGEREEKKEREEREEIRR